MIKKFKISEKAFTFALFFGLLCAVFLSFADFDASCEDIRKNVLRLHIIANSDSSEDQELKLKIRDRILEESENLFEGSDSLGDAIQKTDMNLGRIEDIANAVIRENGFSYEVSARIGDSFFETREYDDFTLPAGTYKSLIIDIGKSEGKNWWCVIFPEICLPSASDIGLSKTVGEDGVDIAEKPNRYILRFKVVELYEEIKNLFK